MSKSEIKLFQDREQVINGLKTEIVSSLTIDPKEIINESAIERITDKTTYETVKKTIRKSSAYIKEVTESRKSITRQIDEFKNEFIQYERELTEPIETTRTHLQTILSDFEHAEKKRIQDMVNSRIKSLTEVGYEQIGNTMKCGMFMVTDTELETIDDAAFNEWVIRGEQETKRLQVLKEEEEKRTQELIAEREALRLEREQIAKERAKLQAELERLKSERNELEAQSEAVEQAYTTTEPTPEPVVSTPTIEFDMQPVQPDPEPVPNEWNNAIDAVINTFRSHSGITKDEYIKLFEELKK